MLLAANKRLKNKHMAQMHSLLFQTAVPIHQVLQVILLNTMINLSYVWRFASYGVKTVQ